MGLEYFGELEHVFLFSKVGAGVFAGDGGFGGGGGADGVVLLAKMFEIVPLIGTSFFHHYNKMI